MHGTRDPGGRTAGQRLSTPRTVPKIPPRLEKVSAEDTVAYSTQFVKVTVGVSNAVYIDRLCSWIAETSPLTCLSPAYQRAASSSAYAVGFIALSSDSSASWLPKSGVFSLQAVRRACSQDVRLLFGARTKTSVVTHPNDPEMFDVLVTMLRAGGLAACASRKKLISLVAQLPGTVAVSWERLFHSVLFYWRFMFVYEAAFVEHCTAVPPILQSMALRDTGRVAQLLAHGAAIEANDKDNNTTLFYAVDQGCILVVEHLLARGAVVDGKNKKGQTALHMAIRRGNRVIIDLLLSCGARVDEPSVNGVAPMFFALRSRNHDALRLLLENGARADVAVLQQQELHGLHISTRIGDTKSAETLIDRGANVNVQDKDGCTPIHYAALKGHVDTCLALLRCGAELDIKANETTTASHAAAHGGFHALGALLKNLEVL